MRKTLVAMSCAALLSSSAGAGTLDDLKTFLNSEELIPYNELELENDIPLIIDLGSTVLIFGDIMEDNNLVKRGVGNIITPLSSKKPMCNSSSIPSGPVEFVLPSGLKQYWACDYIPARSDVHIVDQYKYRNGAFELESSYDFPCGYFPVPPLCRD